MPRAGPNPATDAERLHRQRAQTEERVAVLEAAFADLVEAGQATNVDDEHDPEGATIAFERAQASALLEQAREQVAEIDRALQSVEHGGYGRCERCGEPIAAGRLEALPAARTCIACARAG